MENNINRYDELARQWEDQMEHLERLKVNSPNMTTRIRGVEWRISQIAKEMAEIGTPFHVPQEQDNLQPISVEKPYTFSLLPEYEDNNNNG